MEIAVVMDLIKLCVVQYWAVFISLALLLIIGFKLNWEFFPHTPTTGWINLGVANPASDLIPLINHIDLQEDCELKVVSYVFSEDAHWREGDPWTDHLSDWSKKGVKMQFIGGYPHKKESEEFLEELVKHGDVEVRFLKTPPTRHSVIVSCGAKSFIWIEEQHKDDDTAHGVFYKNAPDLDELEKAHKMFNSLWERGITRSTAM